MTKLKSFCGIVCEECPVMLATISDDRAAKVKLADEWGKEYKEFTGKGKLEPEEISCCGCAYPGDHFVGCQRCEIRTCALDRGVENCGRCEDFESCGSIQGFLEKYPAMRKSLEEEKE